MGYGLYEPVFQVRISHLVSIGLNNNNIYNILDTKALVCSGGKTAQLIENPIQCGCV